MVHNEKLLQDSLCCAPAVRQGTSCSVPTARIRDTVQANILKILTPKQIAVQALVTVAATRHTLTHKAVKAVLEALTPHLGELSHTQQLDMLSALSGPGEHASEPTAAGFLAALCNAALAGRGGLGSAPTDLLFAVVDTSARWRLLLDQGWLGDLEQELMSRLAEEGGDGAGAGQGPPAAANGVGPLRRQLLSGVILPVVRRGQSFSRVRSLTTLVTPRRSAPGIPSRTRTVPVWTHPGHSDGHFSWSLLVVLPTQQAAGVAGFCTCAAYPCTVTP